MKKFNQNIAVLNTQYQVDKAKAFRKKSTGAEKILWEALRNRKVEKLKFRRQHPLSNYVVDFCCLDKKLIIEIDGSIHDTKWSREYDGKRQDELEQAGFTIIRFKNDEVIINLPLVVELIAKTCLRLPSAGKKKYGD